MWLVVIGLALGALSVRGFVGRGWRSARHTDLGWMSERWLAEYRVGSR